VEKRLKECWKAWHFENERCKEVGLCSCTSSVSKGWNARNRGND